MPPRYVEYFSAAVPERSVSSRTTKASVKPASAGWKALAVTGKSGEFVLPTTKALWPWSAMPVPPSKPLPPRNVEYFSAAAPGRPVSSRVTKASLEPPLAGWNAPAVTGKSADDVVPATNASCPSIAIPAPCSLPLPPR